MTPVIFSISRSLFVTLTLILTAALATPLARAQNVLNSAQVAKIGKRIWQNECGGTVAGLTSWNTGEEFASLGIGHFIWYPRGYEGPFEESFPPLVTYLHQCGVAVPAWLRSTPDCPWSSRQAFLAEASSGMQKDLRAMLAASVREQTQFIMARLARAVPKLIKAGGPRVQQNYAQLSQTAEGMYAMIDYVNFKGEGLSPKERYQGEGWGLAQVLGGMSAGTPFEFAESAKRVLARRVKNSPVERKESRWLAGWSNRCDGYKQRL
ncbi:MAG: hypothetical protein ACOYOF_00765 [Verrucomicrobiaceae bacterium]